MKSNDKKNEKKKDKRPRAPSLPGAYNLISETWVIGARTISWGPLVQSLLSKKFPSCTPTSPPENRLYAEGEMS